MEIVVKSITKYSLCKFDINKEEETMAKKTTHTSSYM